MRCPCGSPAGGCIGSDRLASIWPDGPAVAGRPVAGAFLGCFVVAGLDRADRAPSVEVADFGPPGVVRLAPAPPAFAAAAREPDRPDGWLASPPAAALGRAASGGFEPAGFEGAVTEPESAGAGGKDWPGERGRIGDDMDTSARMMTQAAIPVPPPRCHPA
jgi:hypothetical protein